MSNASGDPSPATLLLRRYGGLIVAGLGFVITRLFVAEAVVLSGGPIAIAATAGSLVVGLALAVAGVALSVGAFSPSYVADVSRGCLVGTAATTVALGVTAAATGLDMLGAAFGTQLLVANLLLAGAVGGMVNGHRKASLRRRRATIMHGANRAKFINRLLRHEVLNAATIIDGHAELLRDDSVDRERSVDAIRRGAARIESTVNGVGTIADDRTDDTVSLAAAVRAAVDSAGETDPSERSASVDFDVPDALGDAPEGGAVGVDPSDPFSVEADDRLPEVFGRLIEHAVDARGAAQVRAELSTERHTAAVTLVDDGTPLSDRQVDVLERGSFPEYDDPTNGFALQAASLLVGEYDGSISVAPGEENRVTVRLPRSSADTAVAAVGVGYPALRRAVAAGVGAGLVMGAVSQTTTGSLPVIGSLYGVRSPTIGWITHLFHSVVFAILFVAGVSRSGLGDRASGPFGAGAAGIAWGTLLWLVAAGVVMPVWLRAVGVPATLPNLPPVGLLAHGLWGVTLGIGFTLLGGRFD